MVCTVQPNTPRAPALPLANIVRGNGQAVERRFWRVPSRISLSGFPHVLHRSTYAVEPLARHPTRFYLNSRYVASEIEGDRLSFKQWLFEAVAERKRDLERDDEGRQLDRLIPTFQPPRVRSTPIPAHPPFSTLGPRTVLVAARLHFLCEDRAVAPRRSFR